MIRSAGTLALSVVVSASALAQEPVPLTRLSSPVQLDGMSDEPAWQNVEPVPITVYTPTFQGPPTEHTEIRIGYDDGYLYLAGRLYDSDPNGVRANTLYRDQYSGDDVFAVVLDTYNDHETAVWFATTPAGVRTDRSVSNDAEFTGGFPVNSDWNTYWDVATVQTEDGWFVEMRIPFSSLGFQDVSGRVVMGLITYRFIARKNERHLYPAIPPDWDMGFAKPSQAQRVSLEGVRSSKPVYITPYVLGGSTRAAQLNGTQTGYAFDSDATYEAGVDLKYNPTTNLALDLTVNTDFAQVEADDQQINLTRFSLFFPEKRQFFQERSSVFDFNTGGISRLFHSRRIGLEAGEPIRIFGGARLVGRASGTDIGVLNMQTASVDGLPSENFGVARLRRQVFNPNSNIGALATTRVGDDGSYNVAVGVDGIVRVFGDEYITLKWASTFDAADPTGVSAFDRSRVMARWERQKASGFSYLADYVRSGPDYNPGMGFTLRRDFTFVQNALEYRWFLGANSPFRSVSVSDRALTYVRNNDRTAESASIVPSLEIEFKSGAELSLSVANSYESVLATFNLSGGPPVLPGNYWFHEPQLRFMLSGFRRFRGDLAVSGGSFYDGWRLSFQATPTWSLSRYLELSGEYFWNLVRFPDRDERFNAHLARLKIQAALNIHFSISTFLQYNSADDQASINARIRYHFREGNDLWLVYNEGFNTERNVLAGPQLPLSQARALMIKYTYTLIQ